MNVSDGRKEVRILIEVKGLVKRYGKKTAVDHMDFTIGDGGIYGFLGPNGAGKSTTMNILTGYLQATEGTVLIDGIDMAKKPEEVREKIGYLPEIPPLYPDMTVREYLLFAAGLKGIASKKRNECLFAVMEMTGIREYENILIRKLSKGYKQRVGLAQALLGSPEILILDEPTAGLDPRQIIEIRDLLHILGKQHTIIFSSHILSEVRAVCDEILIISEGRLIAQDTPEHIEQEQSAAKRLLIRVKGRKERIEKALKSLEELEKYEYLEEKPAGEHRYRLTPKEGDLREALSYLLATRRLPLMELVEDTASLEEAFLRLTNIPHNEADKEDEADEEMTEKDE